MKRNILIIIFTLILTLCSCSQTGSPASTNVPVTTDNVTQAPTEEPTAAPTEKPVYDVEILNKYAEDDSVTVLMTVLYNGTENADIVLYVKESGLWVKRLETTGYVGKNGIDKEKEGDSKTPSGDFPITGAFGICENPGTTFSYINVTETTYACDEDCEYYNQIIDTAAVGHTCSGEKMISYSPQYNYGLIVGYNTENVYPLGSAIFVHCKGSKHYTGGCVALDEAEMITVMKEAKPGMRIYIGWN